MEGTNKIISNEDCIKILQNYLQTSNEIKYISSDLKPISDKVEGFLGEHYKLTINYEISKLKKTLRLFVKTKPLQSLEHRDASNAMYVYEKEIFIYDYLLKEFTKYGFDTTFAAKSHYCIPGETLVMDDITLEGYSITGIDVNFSLNHIKCVLKSLAKYHAAGFAYEKKKSKELGREFLLGEEYEEDLKEVFYVHYVDNKHFAMKWWTTLTKTLRVLFDLLPKDKSYKEEMNTFLDISEIGKCFKDKTHIKKTCCHGDLWSNNMLFKYVNNIPINCILIDYQVCRYFYPCFDILLAIFCNTSKETRKLHLKYLYAYYYNNLSDILNSYDVNINEIYPEEDFYESIRLVKVEAMAQMMLAKIIIHIPKEVIAKNVKEDEGLKGVLFDNDVMAAESYLTSENYRNIINEGMDDLREAFIERIYKKK